MRLKTQTLAIAVCFALASIQFASCKKDNASVVNRLSQPDNSNAVADSATDSSLNNGLVAWYTFNGDVLDHSGHNNNVVFNSAFKAQGKSGLPQTAYRFDGVSSYMQVANSKSLNPSTITLYALVKPTGFYQGTCHYNYILSKEYSDYDQGRYIVGYGDQDYYNYDGCDEVVASRYEKFFATYGDGGATATGARDDSDYVRAGKWYAIVYTFDGINSKIYVNGVLKAKVLQSTTFTLNSNPLFIGRDGSPDFPYYFNGIIDEVRIYKRALKANEVLALYNNN